MASDPFDLQRFVDAQEAAMPQVLQELRDGRKRSHWVWFVFPQLKGLGSSAMASHYGLSGLAEARAYLAHPLLGPRLRECCERLLAVPGRSAHDILGSPDDLKFRSCVTLFALAAPHEDLFRRCLDRFCDGTPDPRTTAVCGNMAP